MTKILAFLGKGGVGKTTLSVEMAKHIIKSDKTVCVIGLDQQHNASDLIERENLRLTYLGLYTTAKMSEMVNYIVNHTFLKRFKEYVPIVAPDFITIISLADIIANITESYDYIVIDFPPNHSALSMLQVPSALENMTVKALTLKNRVHKMLTGHDDALEKMDYIYDIVLKFKKALETTRFIGICNPDYMSYLELLKLIQFIRQYYQIYDVVLNKIPDVTNVRCRKCNTEINLAAVHKDMLLETYGMNVITIYDQNFDNLKKLL